LALKIEALAHQLHHAWLKASANHWQLRAAIADQESPQCPLPLEAWHKMQVGLLRIGTHG
tara:strand:+ start:304 stop:483 length:180 start_codon:yes stop_codon:yes gene_type:complete